ncbi:MAG: hypothetical protein US74_C0005G0007 [Parcubacteria group bacterium GW2011_GWA2_38_13]|nr:MAG: hypothetical protein US74_C0005G0007 [Parcubacteria group bacterium GW2011_GWA2_38_13]
MKQTDIVLEAKKLIAEKLYAYAEKHKNEIKKPEQLAMCFDASMPTLRRWKKQIALPTKEMAEKLHAILGFTKAEHELIQKAIARQGSLKTLAGFETRNRAHGKKSVMPQHKAPKDIDERLRRIEEKVFGGKLPIPPSTGEAKKYLPGTLADDWNVSGTRFVLTKENFKTLDTGPWSVAEIDDTIKLIAELRRRLVLLAQNPSSDIREHHLKQLGKEIDELYRSFAIASSVVPIQAAEIVSLERHDFFGIEKKGEK